MWIIEEVIDFDAPEEEAEFDIFEMSCNPRMPGATLVS